MASSESFLWRPPLGLEGTWLPDWGQRQMSGSSRGAAGTAGDMASSEPFLWRPPLGLETTWLPDWGQRRMSGSCRGTAGIAPVQAEAQLGNAQRWGEAEPGVRQSAGLAQPRALESRGEAEPGTLKSPAEAKQSGSLQDPPGELKQPGSLQSLGGAPPRPGSPHNRGHSIPGAAQNRGPSGDLLGGQGRPYLDESDAEEPRQQPQAPQALQAQGLRREQGQQGQPQGQGRRSTAPWQHSLAGGLAGMGTTALLYPFDIVRTRMQVHDAPSAGVLPRVPSAAPPSVALPKYRGTLDAIATIARTEGLRGLYAGLYPSLLGSTVSWALYFLFYNNAKQRYRGLSQGPPSSGPMVPGPPAEAGPPKKLSALAHLAAATEAGVLSTLVTNPIWVVKTRLQLQVHDHSHPPSTAAAPGLAPQGQTPGPSPQAQPAQRPYYRGFHDALRMILKEEGVLGLYKGLGPGLLLVSHGSIQFLAYEELKQWAEKVEGQDALHGGHFLALGAASKLCAVLLTYPYQVLRSRMQIRPAQGATHTKYRTSWQAAALMYRNEGLAGFYKGLSPNLLRVLPSSSLTFFIYETLMGFVR